MQAARGTPLNTSADDSPARPRRTRSLWIFLALALPLYVLDLVTKVLATEHLAGEPPVEIIGTFFTLQYALNPGAAFSMGTEYTVVLSCVSIAAAVVVLWLLRRLASPGWGVALGFLFAGILGNLTDRIFRDPGPLRGHVVDFLAFPNFPIFNIADICINIAAGVIILQAFRGIGLDGSRDRDDVAAAPAAPEDGEA